MMPLDQIDRFELRHPRGVTEIVAGADAIAAGAAGVGERWAGRRLFVVSAAPILALHGERLEVLTELGAEVETIEVPDGERAKAVDVAERIWRALATRGGPRDALLVAFGGGSVGDLTGFVAGAFARGIDWLTLPTTLLAQVDAAIGGKTALDLPEAKNAVGLFHHPVAVWADSELLQTLASAEIRGGLVEVIKIAALCDLELLARVEDDLDRLRSGEVAALGPVVAGAARAKVRIVESDPEERLGPRKLLNFGHTLGHALEAEIGYGQIAHGDAVAHGLRFALRLSWQRGGDRAFVTRLERLLDALEVPALPALEAEALLDRIGRDKKADRSGVEWVLAQAPGEGRFERELPAEWIAQELRSFLGGQRPTTL